MEAPISAPDRRSLTTSDAPGCRERDLPWCRAENEFISLLFKVGHETCGDVLETVVMG